MFGTGVTNPYRLRPFLGARVPVNTSYSPLINIHNPHGSTLKVMEMYTSHGDLHLELPATTEEPLKKIWVSERGNCEAQLALFNMNNLRTID